MERVRSNGKKNIAVRLGVLLAAVVLIGIGLWRQEQAEVLGKAVRICLECIGIG